MTTEVTEQTEISTFNVNHAQSSIPPQNQQSHNLSQESFHSNSPITCSDESDNELNSESNQLLSIELQMDNMLSSMKDMKRGESCPNIEIDNNHFQLYPKGKDSKKPAMAEIDISIKDPAVTQCELPSIICVISVVLPDETKPAVGTEIINLDEQKESIDVGDGIKFNVQLPLLLPQCIETASAMTIKVVLLTDDPQFEDGPIESLNSLVHLLEMDLNFHKNDLQKTCEKLNQLVKHLKNTRKEITAFGKIQSQNRSDISKLKQDMADLKTNQSISDKQEQALLQNTSEIMKLKQEMAELMEKHFVHGDDAQEKKQNNTAEEEVRNWLKNIKDIDDRKYYQMFKNKGFISLELMANIENEDQLQRIGIDSMAHQLQIMKHIKKLKDKCMDPMEEIKKLKESMLSIIPIQSEWMKMKEEIKQFKEDMLSQSHVIKQEQSESEQMLIHNHNNKLPQSKKRVHSDIEQDEDIDMEPNSKKRKITSTQYMKHPLVISLCIGKYNSSSIDDLPGATKDDEKLKRLLRDKYEFTVISPNKIQERKKKNHNEKDEMEITKEEIEVTKKEFDLFLNRDVVKEWEDNKKQCDNDEENKIRRYDGIIFVAACHGKASDDGRTDRIVFSDSTSRPKYIDIAEIKRELNKMAPGIPKIFLWDICRSYGEFDKEVEERGINECLDNDIDIDCDKSVRGRKQEKSDKVHKERVNGYMNTIEIFATIRGDYTEESKKDGGDLVGAFCEKLNGSNIIEEDLEDLAKEIKMETYWRSNKANCPQIVSTVFPEYKVKFIHD